MTKVLQNKDNGLGFLRHWKVMTMTLLLLTFSIGNVWGIDYYTPTNSTEIIYMLNSDGTALVSHSALTNTAKTVQEVSKKCGDPTTVYTTPAATSGNVHATKIKVNNNEKMVQLDVAGCSEIVACHESHSSRHVKATVTEDGKSATTQAGSNSTYFTTITLDGTKSYRVQLEGDNNDLGLYAVVLKKYVDPGCKTPTVSFSASKTLAELNEEVALTFSSQNTSAVSYTIKKGDSETTDASITDGKFTATVIGTYVITATQTADATYCAVEKTVTIKVAPLLTGWVVFDGLVDEALRTSPITYNTVSLTYESDKTSIVDVDKTLDGTTRAYAKAIQLSKTSNGGYLKFTVPTGYTATFTHAFSGTGNRTIILASAKISSTESAGYITTLASVSSGTIKWGEYTTPLAAGDYYICECGSGNWQIAELVVTLTAATPSCSEPAAPTISGTESYTEGQTITLTASHDGDNHGESTTYTWYKGGTWDAAKVTTPVQAAATGSSGYTFTKANCVTGDAGTYWCEAANSTCKSHNADGKAITVAESSLPEVDAPTELSSTAQTANSLTFGWTAAEHASSYDVYLYTDAECTIEATATESNPQNVTTTSATFNGLTVSTTYYCKVQSKGDGTSYKVNGGITPTAASAETPCTAITPTWVYPFTKIAVGITPSNPVDGNPGEGTVTYTSSASSYLDPSNAHWAKAAGSAKITADVAAGGNYCSGSVTSGTIEVVADQTGIITQTLTTGSNAWNASTPTTTDGTNITNLVALHAVGEGYTISGNGNGNNGGQTAKVPSVNATSFDDTKYLEMSFKVAAGKQLNVSAIYIPVQPVTSNGGKFKAILSDGTTDIEGTVSNILNGKLDYIRFASFGTVRGDVTLRIYAWNWSAGYRMGRNVIIAGEVETIPVSSYDITYTAPSNGSYTIQVGEAAAVSANTTANNTQIVTLAATPSSGYKFSAWDVYKTGESTTKVSVSNNTFTMPAYDVTVSATFEAIPTINDLVTIDADYTFEPNATIGAGEITADHRFINQGGNECDYTSGKGIRIKENRALAFKVAANAKVRVTFETYGDLEMQLGSERTGDNNKIYGHSSKSSLTSDVITSAGVVYLTASNQLNMSKLEILYPHTVTYALGDGTGTLPTEDAHYNGEQFNVHDGETGISAPDTKEFSAWNDGTSNYAGGAQYTMGSSNVTLTAQWVAALPEPTITFNNGAYTIGGAALNLSTLFSSNSDGAVTYTVKTAGTTGAAIDGTSFTATTAGSATVTASQAATASYKAKSVDATITISAPSEVDGVKLVEAGALTGNFRTTASLSSTAHTVAGIAYPKYIGLSARTSWSSQPSGPDNYLLQYTLTKKTNKFYFYAYNTNGGVQNVKVYVKEEGENCTTTNVPVSANSGELVSCDVNVSKNAEVCISVSATSLHICQVVVVESGDDQLVAPAVNYNINFNKGRLTAKSGTAKTYEGITYCNNADYKIDNSTYLKLTTRGTHYISFEIPAGQTRKLQVTTGGSAYNVSKTLGDNTTTTKTGNQDFNLGAGIWYINPQGSDVTVTNLKFVAADAAITVAFNSNGGSDVASQALFAGDVVTEPSPAPTKSGYRFVGWQKSGADYDFSTALVAGDAPGFTLDAVWQEVVVVTFDPNNGEDTFTKTADKGAVLAVGDRPSNPTYVGYDFLGWTRNAAAEPIVYVDLASETFSAAATLTAVWEVAQTDASLSALSYNGNAIDVSSAVDVSGVQTYTVHLQWGSTINAALISVTKSADPATMTPITYDSENKRASFMVTSGNGSVSINYAIQFVIDPKRGTSIVKAVVSGGDQSAGFDATGIYGDKGYAKTKNTKKLDVPDRYVGVKLLAGKTFAAGDKLYVETTVAATGGYIELYEEAAGTTLIKATGVRDASAGIEIPSELVGHSEFYIVRKASEGNQSWNGTVDYVEVTREMNPAIKSFKFGDDAATINEGAKTITIEVPFSTDVTALTPTVEAYGNNGATYTPSGATDFTSPVDYVVTDAYSEFSTTYAVTVTKAAASTNADLASLAVAGYSLDFDPATTSYNIVLDYGTTVLPAITYEVADQVTPATAVKAEGGVSGATTITVTPEAGALYNKVYTINFSVSTNQKFVIYDGSTMTNIASRTYSDVSTDFSYTMGEALPIAGDAVSGTLGTKTYTHVIKGFRPDNDPTFSFVVPDDYVAKVYMVIASNSNNSTRTLFISKTATGTVDTSYGYATSDQQTELVGATSEFLLPDTYYFGTNDGVRLYELSVTLYPIDYSRNLTAGRFGTICLPNGGVMIGAALFEVAYHDATLEKIFFDEILNGEMVAGRPYIFLPNEGVSALAVTYTDAANAPEGNYHGLYGSYTQEVLAKEAGNYILYNNQYMYVGASSSNVSVGANRAYFKIGVEGGIPTNAVAPLPGRRRVSMSAVRETPTGLENGELINGENGVQKVLINGELFILRGEKMYDATGRLVK